ncbi:MAG: hypothetical protein SGI72_06825 [Planctomycetota bacterium]|nr:hypothetical protein [Planctomycetota bacterium]
MHDEATFELDQHRHGHGLEASRMLVGLEFVELETARQPTCCLRSREKFLVKVTRMRREQMDASRYCFAIAAEDSRSLAMCYFRDERVEDVEGQARLVQSVVDSKGLNGKRSVAREAQVTLHEPAVAMPPEEAAVLPGESSSWN